MNSYFCKTLKDQIKCQEMLFAKGAHWIAGQEIKHTDKHSPVVYHFREYDKSLIGPKISLLNGANSYFTITYNEGIKSLVNFTGKEIQCEKLDIGNNIPLLLIVSSDYPFTAPATTPSIMCF